MTIPVFFYNSHFIKYMVLGVRSRLAFQLILILSSINNITSLGKSTVLHPIPSKYISFQRSNVSFLNENKIPQTFGDFNTKYILQLFEVLHLKFYASPDLTYVISHASFRMITILSTLIINNMILSLLLLTKNV